MLSERFGGIVIRFPKNELLFISIFVISVCTIMVSIIQLKLVYAKEERIEDYVYFTFVPYYWMIVLIGGIIMLTLSYVGWKKYKAEEKKERKKNLNR